MMSLKVSYGATFWIKNYGLAANRTASVYPDNETTDDIDAGGFNASDNDFADQDIVGHDVTRGNSSTSYVFNHLQDLSSFQQRVAPHMAIASLCLLQNVILLVLYFARRQAKSDDINNARFKTVSIA